MSGDISSYVDPISASLQNQINNIDVSGDISSYVNPISASLQNQILINSDNISTLESNVTSISGNLGSLQTQVDNLDIDYVNITGATMSGDLTISPLSGSGNSQVFVNSSGKLSRSDYNYVIGGKISLILGQSEYTINNSNITLFSNPVCSIKSPNTGEVIITPSITTIDNGSFDVELSMSPPISGYFLNWISF